MSRLALPECCVLFAALATARLRSEINGCSRAVPPPGLDVGRISEVLLSCLLAHLTPPLHRRGRRGAEVGQDARAGSVPLFSDPSSAGLNAALKAD